MSKQDKLVVDCNRSGRWFVVWECWTDDLGWDQGATLGDTPLPSTEADSLEADGEHAVATLAAREVVYNLPDNGCVEHKPYAGWFFEQKKHAELAKKRAMEAVKALRARAKQKTDPWPLWAITAKAAGWKPPEGWKP